MIAATAAATDAESRARDECCQIFSLKISQNFSKRAKKVTKCYFEMFKALKLNY